MERIGRGGISVQQVVELYKKEGVEINVEQAAAILDFLRRMAKIVVNQCVISPASAMAETEGNQCNSNQHQ
jgi:hypothetical protein